MVNTVTLLVFLLVVCHGLSMAKSVVDEGDDEWFKLKDSKSIIKTDAGQMRVLTHYGATIVDRPLHIGFITMEPKSLLVPQYLDSSFIIFIRRGEAKLGFIYKDRLAEKHLKSGDVYPISAGSVFYIVNTGEGQRLHILCGIDPSESFGLGAFQSFYTGGGTTDLASILAGFDPEILEPAFNVSRAKLGRIFARRQRAGPIMYLGDSQAPGLWSEFLKLKEEERLQQLRKMVGEGEGSDGEGEEEEEEEEEKDDDDERGWSWSWSWGKALKLVLRNKKRKTGEGDKSRDKSPDSYNIYDDKPDFRNRYGWSTALDRHKFPLLRKPDIGVFFVNLAAGSMMAPHVNPRASEYGIVLSGGGRVEIVFPNGSAGRSMEVKEGDVFFVPRYFPFCQIASRSGSLEFFGFTTSASRNTPQFLAGATSILRTLMGPELAASFGEREQEVRRVVHAQPEAVILPSARAAPGDVHKRGKEDQRGRGHDAGAIPTPY